MSDMNAYLGRDFYTVNADGAVIERAVAEVGLASDGYFVRDADGNRYLFKSGVGFRTPSTFWYEPCAYDFADSVRANGNAQRSVNW